MTSSRSEDEAARRALLHAALRRAVQEHGAVRLLAPAGKADQGLFPATVGRNGLARLVAGVFAEEPRASNQPRWVRPTREGLEQLIAGTLSGERAGLVCGASPLYQQSLFAAWSGLVRAHGWKDDEPFLAGCGAKLAVAFQPEGGADGADFRRILAAELVLSWKHVRQAEAREGIARAMRAAGMEQIGCPGERVAFSGKRHVSEFPLFPGDEAVVAEPGWLLPDGEGGYLLEKAVVDPV